MQCSNLFSFHGCGFNAISAREKTERERKRSLLIYIFDKPHPFSNRSITERLQSAFDEKIGLPATPTSKMDGF